MVERESGLTMRTFWLACLCMWGALPALAQDDWPPIGNGMVVLFRHALAPGGGDPSGFRLNDCSSQRNLSEEGRVQAKRIGEAFLRRGIEVGSVWSSQWCRTRDTADLAFPGKRVDHAAFNSFFDSRQDGALQTRAALDLLTTWKGPGVLVVVTHQINIIALTGIVPGSGEGIVAAIQGRELQVKGRISP